MYRVLLFDPVLTGFRGEPEFRKLLAPMKANVDRMRARVEREGL
jgi:hypothetical protein